ncbi:hypothetical protein JCM9279_004378 [Rhodotorula babjevae]
MAKHTLSEHSDSDQSHSESTPKRRRTASPLPRSTPPRDRNGDVDFDPDAQDDDEQEEDEDADMSDDEETRRQVARLQQTQSSRPSKIAEAGVIQQVDLQSFMCHAHTTVNFGPQVNFLIGVNGSGKSAILTGITMALGGNAKATNRGGKGGDLIMEGKTSARCAVTLANKGAEAYQHHVYGDSITIERTLNKTGGTYKIKNHEGKTVDNKKATLDSILDSFNIQVDNPMTVLTQDQSRQFLASASPKDKYTFFLRGTQLAQLNEEYEQIRSNTETMEEALGRKQEVLPELKDAYRQAKERATDARAAIEQQGNLANLKNQLAWSFVDEIETRIEFGENFVATERANLADCEEKLAALEAKVEAANAQISDLRDVDQEMHALLAELRPQAAELDSKIKGERERLRKWKDFERQMSHTVTRLKETIADFERQILAEETKLSRDLEAERRPLRDQVEQANAEIVELAERMRQSRRTADDTDEIIIALNQDYQNVRSAIDTARGKVDEIKRRVEFTRRSATNNMLAYGDKTQQFLQAINQDRSWREKPLGPIGLFVKLEHKDYANVLESFFSQTLNAYICTNHEDATRLRQLHRRFGLDHNTPIITQSFDGTAAADMASKQPDKSILTVLRACTITHPLVLQALVVSSRIERAALVPYRPDGDALMRTNPHNVDAAYSADSFRVSINQGRSASSTMQAWRGAPRLQQDVTSILRRLDEELAAAQAESQHHEQQKVAKGNEIRAAEARKKQSEDDFKRAQKRTHQLNRVINECTAKLEEEQPNNIAALQENKRETEEELASAVSQFQAGAEANERDAVNSEAQAAVEAKVKLENKIKKNENLISQTAKALDKQIAEIQNCKVKIDQVSKTMASIKHKIDTYSGEVAQAKALLEQRTEQASAVCERPRTGKQKESKKLQKEIETVERALKEREKRQGASIEQILEELEIRKKVASEAVRQVNELASLVGVLKEAYNTRVGRWADFREHLVARAKQNFSFHLVNRGFDGSLKFNHVDCALNILIRTEQEGQDGKKAKRKDTKSLSGGEKSFSTICLLLTMWESVGCPVRCLDEFDVFMDAVNRRIAMKMMIDAAKTANQTQFILITPQEMSSIKWGDEVKVIKLDDPKRSQGALARGR